MDGITKTTELLEAILLELPPRDIIVSQRISTRFLDTIKGSLKLQRSLFTVPDSGSSSNIVANAEQVLLNSAIADRIKQSAVVHFKVGQTYVGVLDLGVRNVRKSIGGTNKRPKYELCVCLEASQIRNYVGVGARVCELGSWENMFISQPACKVWVSLGMAREFGQWAERGLDLQGTLGEVMEHVERVAVV
jgi:hypothetical protein